jgi:dTMP kinase
MAFLVFEGIDGAGKSTLLASLAERLRARGREVCCLREPGSTPLGERVRQAVLDPATGDLAPWTEACLFTACRAEMVVRCIRPALADGHDVLLDRYLYSTVAYQGFGDGLGEEVTRRLQEPAVGTLLPDVVFLVDVSVLAAFQRRGPGGDRMESKGEGFLSRARDGYLAQAREDPLRWEVLDGTAPPSVVADSAWQRLLDRGLLGVRP